MTFKFDFPVKLPRFTTAEFEQKKREYNAKYGYRIHVPGFEDIIHWTVTPEPTTQELALYKKKDVNALGERRYNDIKVLMEKKREKFLRMLASPTPRIARNAGSIMTFLDDVNDTLGTFGCIARFAAQKMPSQIAKVVIGPAGWLFTAAEIANIGMTLSRLPWKSKRLQHELHAAIKDHPLSKKARLKQLNKLKRLTLSAGESIELLQTTDNVFGVGLCLGSIVGLVQDVAFGLYRHVKGEKVTVTGMPAPFYWFDRVWNKALRNIVQLWTGIPEIDDRELGKSMVAFNLATQASKAWLQDTNPLDMINRFDGVEIPVPYPSHPSTEDVILSEVSSVEEYSRWPLTDKKWQRIIDPWEEGRSAVTDNLKAWWARNRQDTESMVCSQNAVEAGQNVLALEEGDEAVEYDYEVTAMSILKLLNNEYRFPTDATEEQGKCFFEWLNAYNEMGLQPDMPEILQVAKEHCGFEFTTEVPARNTVPYSELSKIHDSAIYRLQQWYFKDCISAMYSIHGPPGRESPENIPYWKKVLQEKIEWLEMYGWDMPQVKKYQAGMKPAELDLYSA